MGIGKIHMKCQSLERIAGKEKKMSRVALMENSKSAFESSEAVKRQGQPNRKHLS